MGNSLLVTELGGVISYAEYARGTSQKFSYTGKRLHAQRVFTEIAWLSHIEFAQNMVGWSEIRKEGAVEYIHRIIPKRYPIFGAFNKRPLFAREVMDVECYAPTGEGIDRDGRFGVYSQARVTVGYDTVSYKILSDDSVRASGLTEATDESTLKRYVTRGVLPAGEYLQLPQGSHRWISDNLPVNQTLGRNVNRVDLTYIWHEVPGWPTALLSSLGTINSAVFDNFAVGTLYLVAIEVVPWKSIVGTTVYDITYRMRRCDIESGQLTHNYFLRHKGFGVTSWDRPVSGDIGVDTPVFRSVDHANLFKGPFGFVDT